MTEELSWSFLTAAATDAFSELVVHREQRTSIIELVLGPEERERESIASDRWWLVINCQNDAPDENNNPLVYACSLRHAVWSSTSWPPADKQRKPEAIKQLSDALEYSVVKSIDIGFWGHRVHQVVLQEKHWPCAVVRASRYVTSAGGWASETLCTLVYIAPFCCPLVDPAAHILFVVGVTCDVVTFQCNRTAKLVHAVTCLQINKLHGYVIKSGSILKIN